MGGNLGSLEAKDVPDEHFGIHGPVGGFWLRGHGERSLGEERENAASLSW